jgi:thiamine biosynthesis lipoprotein
VKRARTGVNRRELLRFRRRSVASAAQAGEVSPVAGRADLVTVSRPAMGSYFEVRLPSNTPGAVDLACCALDVIDALEAQLTVYRDDSEVSRLNALAHLHPVQVEAGLFDLLETAVGVSQETSGAYDVTAGALSEAWGFVRGPRRVPDRAALADALLRTGWRHLRLDPERRTVAFDREGVKINLGSIGKGYAIDRAVALIAAYWWPTSALVHGGRSSVYALGSPPGQIGGRWEVAVRNPFQPESPLGTIRLRNRALGTSGSAFQQFEIDGKVYGHIIDPRTGEPAGGPASVTVLAPSAALADALSTAFYLLGPETAREYIGNHPEFGAIFVERPDPDSPVSLQILGLGEHDFVPSGNPL